MYNDLRHLVPAAGAGPAETLRRPAGDACERLPDAATAVHPAPFEMHQLRQNRLLALLPDTDWRRLAPRLELVALPLGTTLQEAGGPLPFAYFPTTAVVSMVYGNQDGSSAEIAVVGHDGMLGVGVLMGGQGGPERAVVRGEGHAYRLDAGVLRQEFDGGGATAQVLLRYTQLLIAQMAQTAVCNRHHALDEQLCRWLLASLDRSPRASMAMTHELIAGALGVRREGVTQALGKLRRLGLVDCSRGRVEVLDRAGLAARACECHASMEAETARLLPPRVPHG